VLDRWKPPPKDPSWGEVEQTDERRMLTLLDAIYGYGISEMNRAGYFECRLCHHELGTGHSEGCPLGALGAALSGDAH
jgi:hypothetical protein